MKSLTIALLVAALLMALPAGAKNPVVVKPETIVGTLTIVTVEDNTIYVKADTGITYDFRVEPATEIIAGDRTLKMDDLTGEIGKSIEVVFRPLRAAGNAAITIEIK